MGFGTLCAVLALYMFYKYSRLAGILGTAILVAAMLVVQVYWVIDGARFNRMRELCTGQLSDATIAAAAKAHATGEISPGAGLEQQTGAADAAGPVAHGSRTAKASPWLEGSLS